jgi:hypothetical protein
MLITSSRDNPNTYGVILALAIPIIIANAAE